MNIPLLIIVAAVFLTAAAPAGAVTTTLDARGQLVVDSHVTFPIGLSGAPASVIPQTTAAGINFYQWTPPTGAVWSDPATIMLAHAYDQAAASSSAWVWENLRQDNAAAPWFNIKGAELSAVIAAIGGDPGVGAWHGAAEPASHDTPPSAVAHMGMDNHLWATIEAANATPTELAAYAPYSDVNGPDVFPINMWDRTPNLHSVGRITHAFILADKPSRAVWTTLQVCAGGAHNASGYILPTLKQTRFMAWDAIINGARGLNWFGADHPNCMSPADQARGFNWTWWNTAGKPLIAELHRWSPEISGQHNIILPAKPGWESMRFTSADGETITVRANLSTYTVTVTPKNG